MSDAYRINIISPDGAPYRISVSHRRIVLAICGLFVALAGIMAFALFVVPTQRDDADLVRAQRDRLVEMDRETRDLDDQVRAMERRDAELEKLMSTAVPQANATDRPHAPVSRAAPTVPASYAGIARRLTDLRSSSRAVGIEHARMRALVARVLVLRRLAQRTRDGLLAAVPSLEPIAGAAIGSPFGWRVSPWPEFHAGLDLEASYGTPVRAAATGVVREAGFEAGGYGIKVDLDHGRGFHTWYAHLSRVAVVPGERVTRGETIAYVGSTGESTGPHLHYQVMRDGRPIDPAPFLRGVPPNVLASLK